MKLYYFEEIDPNALKDYYAIDIDLGGQMLDEELAVLLTGLRRIGFYPDDDENFTVSDFGLDREISQYLIVVNTKPNRELNYITMES